MPQLNNPSHLIEVDKAKDCKSLTIEDVTTDYGDSGVIEAESVLTHTINVYKEGDTIPYAFVFEITSGTIDTATLTKPDGTEVDIADDLENTNWPFSEDNSNILTILNTYLDLEEDDELEDGVWTINSIIAGEYENGDTYQFTTNNTQYPLINCAACCCVNKMFLEVDADCACADSKLASAMKAQGFLNAATASANAGDYDSASKNLKMAAELCTSNCKGC